MEHKPTSARVEHGVETRESHIPFSRV